MWPSLVRKEGGLVTAWTVIGEGLDRMGCELMLELRLVTCAFLAG